MSKNLIASLLIASTAVLAAPAFASGYGPANHYNPTVGAPASQRGISTQTIAAEQSQANVNSSAFGGVSDTQAQSGHRVNAGNTQSLYSHN
jgi:hypothetical protein